MDKAMSDEAFVQRTITDIKMQISDLQLKLKRYEADLQFRIANRQKFQEEAFEKAYGHSAQKVRDDYVKLVTQCCYQGGDGYAVNVPGTNPEQAHHWVLRPEHRAVCEPTPIVKKAYEIIGVNISIANTTHIERWGN